MEIRPLEAHEWSLWRDLRIRAVRDSPDAFRPTLDEELAHDDGWWEDIVRRTVEHPRGTLLVAEVESKPVGMLFARSDPDESKAEVGAMWVDSAARGLGVGGAMLDAAIAWAHGRGVGTMTLWVTDGNAAAERLYADRGFTPTGATGLLRDGADLTIFELGRDIGTPRDAGH